MINHLEKSNCDCRETNRFLAESEDWTEQPANTRVALGSALSEDAGPVWRETEPTFILCPKIKELIF
jgi:hypothetical protein